MCAAFLCSPATNIVFLIGPCPRWFSLELVLGQDTAGFLEQTKTISKPNLFPLFQTWLVTLGHGKGIIEWLLGFTSPHIVNLHSVTWLPEHSRPTRGQQHHAWLWGEEGRGCVVTATGAQVSPWPLPPPAGLGLRSTHPFSSCTAPGSPAAQSQGLGFSSQASLPFTLISPAPFGVPDVGYHVKPSMFQMTSSKAGHPESSQ